MNAAPAFVDQRALLHSIGCRLVRVVATETNPYAAALYGVLVERQISWPHEEWARAVDELYASALTVSEWLAKEAVR